MQTLSRWNPKVDFVHYIVQNKPADSFRKEAQRWSKEFAAIKIRKKSVPGQQNQFRCAAQHHRCDCRFHNWEWWASVSTEQKSFCKFLSCVKPQWNSVCRKTVRAKIMEKGKPFRFNFAEYRRKFGKPSSTVDIWSSKQRLGYMAVTLHLQTERGSLTWSKSLRIIATQILNVTASSAPVERVFSMTGNICTATRTSMSPDLLSALARAKYNGVDEYTDC